MLFQRAAPRTVRPFRFHILFRRVLVEYCYRRASFTSPLVAGSERPAYARPLSGGALHFTFRRNTILSRQEHTKEGSIDVQSRYENKSCRCNAKIAVSRPLTCSTRAGGCRQDWRLLLQRPWSGWLSAAHLEHRHSESREARQVLRVLPGEGSSPRRASRTQPEPGKRRRRPESIPRRCSRLRRNRFILGTSGAAR